ncbi:MAG: ribosome biogenesis GTPase Der [Alphaproteobacteria bacterium]|nr:ribosome biogenesis GTPase Der [Alphaproteobacteria bacterium]MDD9920135.1 ribosome biogenesis GTPase Der [Alphaproteobacteria bacterium]
MRIVLLGRPNVGKSSLFNALTQTSEALVAPTPGVTRDWREGPLTLPNGQIITLIDTAGLDDTEAGLAGEMSALSRQQAQQADAILFVVDGKEGILPTDETFAQEIRRLNKPSAVLVNKADTKNAEETALEAGVFGLGDVLLTSAAHSDGMYDIKEYLQDTFCQHLSDEKLEEAPDSEEDVPPEEKVLSLAVVGRPNAGKSTLVNKLIGEDRLLTGDIAGLTRESISIEWAYKGRQFKLTDTPGQRRKAKVVEDLEKAAVDTAQEAIYRANVVVLLVDAEPFDVDAGVSKIFHQQDAAIAQAVIDAGRPLVVALNKWDAVRGKQEAREQSIYHVTNLLYNLAGVPVVPISAERGKGIDKLLTAALDVYDRWHTRVGTAKLNRLLEEAVARKAPPLAKKWPVRLKYITQTQICPPSFTVWGTRVEHLPDSYKRYLTNMMREAFNLSGLPMRMHFKSSDNPYK